MLKKFCSFNPMHLPVHFSPVEGFGVKGDSGRVASLGTADGHFPSELHPWHGENRAGVGTGQCEHVLFFMLQKVQYPWQP